MNATLDQVTYFPQAGQRDGAVLGARQRAAIIE
jgi:hypothetical protein